MVSSCLGGVAPPVPTLVAVFAPLVAVPLSVIMLYLRTLREHQVTRSAEFTRRIEVLEKGLSAAREVLLEIQRDYTTKEEWLRESMAARQQFERILTAVTRLETEIDVVRGWSSYIESRLRAVTLEAERGSSGVEGDRPGQTEQR
jgi:hypothetical protein